MIIIVVILVAPEVLAVSAFAERFAEAIMLRSDILATT